MADDLAKLRVVLEAETARYTKEIEKVNTKLSRFEKNQTKSLKRIKTGFNGLAGAATAFLSVGLAKQVLYQADAMVTLNQRIKTATKDTGDYAEVAEELFKISQRNGVELAESVGLFQNLSIAAKSLGKSSADVLKLSEAVQQLGILGGSSQEALNNSLRQFSQAMAGGIVRAEEFNSIIENTPLIAQRIAEGMGETVGSLRLAVVEGNVLSKDVFDVLLKQSADVNAEFQQMPLTIARASTQLGNAWDRFISRADEAASATGRIARAIEAVSLLLDDTRSAESKHLLDIEPLLKRQIELQKNIREGRGMQYFIDRDKAELSIIQNKIAAKREEFEWSQKLAQLKPVNIGAESKTGSITGLTNSTQAKASAPVAAYKAAQIRLKEVETDYSKNLDRFAALQAQAVQKQQSALTQVEYAIADPMERLEMQQAAQQQLLDDNLLLHDRYETLKTELQAKHTKQREQLLAAERSMQLQNASQLFDGMAGLSAAFAGEQSGIYRGLFAVSKAFAIADSIIKIQQGLAGAASLTFPANIAAMAAVASATGGLVSNIQSVSFGGARATGGPVSSGSAYLVGERGPELFTPSNSGNITPNDKLGGDLTVNINEDASKAGQVERNGNELTVFVAAALNEVNRQIGSGRGVASTIERRYNLTRRAS